MTTDTRRPTTPAWWLGMREAIPLLGGYIPVAISFGLVSIQAGFTTWEATLISLLIYAGASQFLFIGMAAAGAPLWLLIAMTLLINVRHMVYGPNLAPWLTTSRWWPWLMHGLTDQVFALAHTRMPQLEASQRLGWYSGAALLAWVSWVAGTALGAIAGDWLMAQWPLLGEVMPFALPALFLVLVMPRFTSLRWTAALLLTIAIAMTCTLNDLTNLGIPLAAGCGVLCFYLVRLGARPNASPTSRGSHE
ncbi:AzlC family ABC transporter permease [Halomonas almeriensis]|uniref:AzlC family ABC transporter permease n=1 Tax=Halomonas almeriensis TaxID=308163 RepID=UPI0025B299B8|nr:AzlC family ABC transporter permease [Halomonas almeriensis]MDN3553751.1 AzlC family ABC transporter permease [Halomonas almeriensis]